MEQSNGLSRRDFLTLGGAVAGAGVLGAALSGCSPKPQAPDTTSRDNMEFARSYWLGEEPQVSEADIVEEETCELLIIGAGNAGMMAAGTAADLGVDFIVAEKGSEVGDTREYIAAVNSKFTKSFGSDPVDGLKLVNEVTRYASGRVSQDVIKTWIDESAEMIEWVEPIMTAAGKELSLTVMSDDHKAGGTDYYEPTLEHFFNPTYEYPMRNNILEWYINDRGNEIRYGHELVKLCHDDGKVTGALFRTEAGLKRITATKGTLLATGGYAANPEMVRANLPLVERCVTASSFSLRCDGYGLRAGLWAGGVKDVNGAPVIFDRGAVPPGVDAGYRTNPDGTQHFPGTVYQLNIGSQPFLKVNRRGNRFANESVPYDTFCNMASYQPGGVYCQIFDGSAVEDIDAFKTTGCASYTKAMLDSGIPLEDYMFYVDGGDGLMMKADTLDELADMLGFQGEDKQTLFETIDHYNALVDSGKDTDYGKEPHRLSRIDTPPYYGCWYGGSLLTTLDGLRIDGDMRVLDADSNVIEGLFAAGDVSGCFFSDNYPEYLVSCACGRTCTEGRHVAKFIAAMA
ncbi:MAG: FAD-binding protein [Eggerthellaceae bacterium]|nr:FAD-binding protein [Eggerthellaceae bacterium]